MKISITITALLFAIAAGTFKPKVPVEMPQKQDLPQDTISTTIAAVEMEIKSGIQKARFNAHKNTVQVKKIAKERKENRNCCFFIDSIKAANHE